MYPSGIWARLPYEAAMTSIVSTRRMVACPNIDAAPHLMSSLVLLQRRPTVCWRSNGRIAPPVSFMSPADRLFQSRAASARSPSSSSVCCISSTFPAASCCLPVAVAEASQVVWRQHLAMFYTGITLLVDGHSYAAANGTSSSPTDSPGALWRNLQAAKTTPEIYRMFWTCERCHCLRRARGEDHSTEYAFHFDAFASSA